MAKKSTKLDMDIYTKVDIQDYQNTENEQKLIGQVKTREYSMRSRISRMYPMWNEYRIAYDSYWEGDTDGYANIKNNLTFATMTRYESEMQKRKPTTDIESEEMGGELERKVLTEALKDDMLVNNRDIIFARDEFYAAMYGGSIINIDYEHSERTVNDTDVDDDGNIEITVKKDIKKGIVLRNVDPFNFMFDERANNIDDAEDCIEYEYISYEKLLTYDGVPTYKNIKSVVPQAVFEQNPIQNNKHIQGKSVKLTKYYNQAMDKQIIIANDKTIIRETPILNPLHWLPYSFRQLFRDPQNQYSHSLPGIILPIQSHQNMMESMYIESIKRSSNQAYLAHASLGLDSNALDLNNQIIETQGQLQGNFETITGNQPNANNWNISQDFYKKIAFFTGLDITSSSQESIANTAYQEAIRQQMASLFVLHTAENRDMSYTRLYKMYIAMIQKFYPRKRILGLVPVDKYGKANYALANTVTPKVTLKGKAVQTEVDEE